MPTGMQTSNSEEMEEGESSEDEARLSIVESSDGGQQGGPRTFLRSLSVGDGSYSSPQGAAQHNASDAVESLLLLGQGHGVLHPGGSPDVHLDLLLLVLDYKIQVEEPVLRLHVLSVSHHAPGAHEHHDPPCQVHLIDHARDLKVGR